MNKLSTVQKNRLCVSMASPWECFDEDAASVAEVERGMAAANIAAVDGAEITKMGASAVGVSVMEVAGVEETGMTGKAMEGVDDAGFNVARVDVGVAAVKSAAVDEAGLRSELLQPQTGMFGSAHDGGTINGRAKNLLKRTVFSKCNWFHLARTRTI